MDKYLQIEYNRGVMLRASEIEQLRVDKLSISGSLLVRAAAELGLDYQLLPERTILMGNGTISHFFKGSSLPCNNMVASVLSLNKYLSRKILKSAGIPVPPTITLRAPSQWRKVLESRLHFPLVVKPLRASHANGATMNIQNNSVLRKAVYRAFSYMKKSGRGNRVLVEDFFEGHDLRLLVIGDKVVSSLMRRPAYVIGNGKDSVRQLVKDFNAEWKSFIHYDYPLCPIPIDSEVYRCLKSQKKSMRGVPAVGEEVQLRWNGNVSTGGRAFDITDKVHPAIQAIAVQATKALHLEIAGIDILAKDYESGDITSANIIVLEANDAPGLDIHQLPYSGKGCHIGKLILEHIFK